MIRVPERNGPGAPTTVEMTVRLRRSTVTRLRRRAERPENQTVTPVTELESSHGSKDRPTLQ